MSDARRVAFTALLALETGKTDRLAPDLRQLTPRDRAFAIELARGVERRRLFLDHVLAQLVRHALPREPDVLVALRLGAYQLLDLTKVPPWAAVTETLDLLRGQRGFANAVLRRLARMVRSRAADPALPRREIALPGDRALVFDAEVLPEFGTAAYVALLHALPEPLVARWLTRFGLTETVAMAQAAARPPVLFLRARRALGGAGLAVALANEGIETAPTSHPWCLRWSGGLTPFESRCYAEGAFVAQDLTALRAVEAVGAQAGETIIDLCAAPGTKALWLAECVGPSGQVHAYDADPTRRPLILENASRCRVQDVIVLHAQATDLPVADRVLVDVPCSNTGVLARRVEVRRRWSPDLLPDLARTQTALLCQALTMVKIGGVVVYSTCSVEAEENEQVVAAALQDGHRLVHQELVLPVSGQWDGGFYAVLIRAPVAGDSCGIPGAR